MEVNWDINCLFTNILQNIFCVQQKSKFHTGLEQHEGGHNVSIYFSYLCFLNRC